MSKCTNTKCPARTNHYDNGCNAHSDIQDCKLVMMEGIVPKFKLETIDDIKYRMVTERLTMFDNNRNDTARSLGISGRTLRNYIKDMNNERRE